MTDFALCSGFDHAEADGIGFLSYARVLSGSRYQGGLRNTFNDANSGGSINIPTPYTSSVSWRTYLRVSEMPNNEGVSPGVGLFTVTGTYNDTEFRLTPDGHIAVRFYGESYTFGLSPSGLPAEEIGQTTYALAAGEWYLIDFMVYGNTVETRPPSSNAEIYIYVNGIEWFHWTPAMTGIGNMLGPNFSGFSTYFGISTNPNPPYWTQLKFGPLGTITYLTQPGSYGAPGIPNYYNTSTNVNLTFDDFALWKSYARIGAGVSFFLLANATGTAHTMTGDAYNVSQQWYSNDGQTYLSYVAGQTGHLLFPTAYAEGARSNIRHLIVNWSGANGTANCQVEPIIAGRSLGAKTKSGAGDLYLAWPLSEIGTWNPTDQVEVKITVTSVSGSARIYNMFLSVECETFDFPTLDETYNCVTGTYIGNGTTQEITVGFRPQLIIVAANNVGSVTSQDMIKIEAGFPWTHEFNGVSPATLPLYGKSIPIISSTGFRAHGPESSNTAGHSYSYLAIRDGGQRIMFRYLAPSIPAPPKTVKFFRDFTNEQLNWTPDWIFCFPRSYAQNMTTVDSWIGPASTTSFKTGTVSAALIAGDFINSVTVGQASISTTMTASNSVGQQFFGFQEGGFTSTTQLVKCVSWTGTGTSTTQTIAVPDVGNKVPCFIWMDVSDTTTANRAQAGMWIKGMVGGNRYNGVSWTTTEIRSVSAGAFVVGNDSNKLGVPYQALVLVEGTDSAPATQVVGSGGLLFAATGWPRGADIEIEHHYECWVWPKAISTVCDKIQEQAPLSACLSPEQELFNG